MKKFLLLLTMASTAAFAEEYDIAKYCAKVSDTVGGSYQIEQACREQEATSKATLQKMKLPTRIENYCSKVASTIGGSYQIKLACAQQELAARNQIK
ncbi:hypothetical protein [Massilia putida]|uniref:hypothetical protein n=1 Tax=Massilia putida TaxID=1141883 RepID=UPI001E40B140|nr:hypothetical protein [Massilia putida]